MDKISFLHATGRKKRAHLFSKHCTLLSKLLAAWQIRTLEEEEKKKKPAIDEQEYKMSH